MMIYRWNEFSMPKKSLNIENAIMWFEIDKKDDYFIGTPEEREIAFKYIIDKCIISNLNMNL